MAAHLRKTKSNRQGYFKKKAENPKPNYKKAWENGASKNGFEGGRTEVHHILPWESIDQSVQELKPAEKARYIKDVQWVTKWNINDDQNLMGLPTFHSYQIATEVALKALAKLSPTSNAKIAQLSAWFNGMSAKLRKDYFGKSDPPDGYAIHNPRSWGHPEFSKLVKDELLTRVWQPLNEKKKAHDLDAATVADEMNAMSDERMKTLVGRSGATRAAFAIRNTRGDAKWYEPFVMAPVKKAPL